MSRYGYNMSKQAFRDALCLRFRWTPTRLPQHCPCGHPFSVDHTLSCPKGAMPSIQGITAELLTEICPNIGIEPTFQPLNSEVFNLRTTNTEDEARLDIKAQNFWDSSRWSTFFDVRVFNAHAPSTALLIRCLLQKIRTRKEKKL